MVCVGFQPLVLVEGKSGFPAPQPNHRFSPKLRGKLIYAPGPRTCPVENEAGAVGVEQLSATESEAPTVKQQSCTDEAE